LEGGCCPPQPEPPNRKLGVYPSTPAHLQF
jgi:hypothetical protein